MLGPLCVGMSAFLVEDWNEGDQKPCLWKMLSAGVCRETKDKRGRVAIADSKALKLPNDVAESNAKRHPLMHLERGVLAAAANLETESVPLTDSALHDLLEAKLSGHPWYEGTPVSLPVSTIAPMLGISANLIARSLEESRVRLLAMRCRVMDEREFNSVIGATGNKGDVCIATLAHHLKIVLELAAAHPGASIRVACDKLGGRDNYALVLERILPDWDCSVIEQGADRSVYELNRKGTGAESHGAFRVSFQPEAEDEHLPVALASMIAKYVRELAMHRFNRYWSARMPELKPTAGYRQDAQRWLADAAAVVSKEDRLAMIRRA